VQGLDRKDILWDATPADWAKHGNKTEVEAFLGSKRSESSSMTSAERFTIT